MVSELWAIMWFSIMIEVFALNKELYKCVPNKQRERVPFPWKSMVFQRKHGCQSTIPQAMSTTGNQ